MQIHRTLPPVLQPLGSPANTEPSAQPPGAGSLQAGEPAVSGVVYTASSAATKDDTQVPDLNSLSMEEQLKLGQRMGVFTKITYSKEGRMVANPFASNATKEPASSADPYAGIAAPEFLSGAVSAMRDFEEGMAVLKSHAPVVEAKGADFWSGSLRSLQNAAAKLNVFA